MNANTTAVPRILYGKATDRIYRSGDLLVAVRIRKQHRDRGRCGWFSADVEKDEDGRLILPAFCDWHEHTQPVEAHRMVRRLEQVHGEPLPSLTWGYYRGHNFKFRQDGAERVCAISRFQPPMGPDVSHGEVRAADAIAAYDAGVARVDELRGGPQCIVDRCYRTALGPGKPCARCAQQYGETLIAGGDET